MTTDITPALTPITPAMLNKHAAQKSTTDAQTAVLASLANRLETGRYTARLLVSTLEATQNTVERSLRDMFSQTDWFANHAHDVTKHRRSLQATNDVVAELWIVAKQIGAIPVGYDFVWESYTIEDGA